MTRNRLYVLLSTACLLGYVWLFITYTRSVTHEDDPGICLFKQITGIPCPSCGSTRSVLTLLHGDLIGALIWNPFGLILMGIMVISPVWILYDLLASRQSLYRLYIKSEQFLRRKWIMLLFIGLVLLNWIWNIMKGL